MTAKPQKSGNISVRAFSIALLAAFILITGLVTVRRAYKTSNDFDTFYNAGRAVLTGEGLYYTGEYYQDKKQEGPFLYPPFAAIVFAPFALIPLGPAAFLWNLLNIGLFFASLLLISYILNRNRSEMLESFQKLSLPDRLLLLTGTLAVLLDNLTMAQANILVFFLCVLSLWHARRAKPWQAGLILAAAVMIKLTPLIFCLYFLIKRKGRVLAGAAAGFVLFTLVIPTLIFGPEENRIYHRQWAGRTLKPSAVRLLSRFQPDETHPLKQSSEKLEHNRLYNLLIEKNQSLEAGLTRLFLKDRVKWSYSPQPIYAAYRYEKMPVLFGGIPRRALPAFILFIQGALGRFLIWLWVKTSTAGESTRRTALEIALAFFSMTLFPPLARSHQFIAWVFGFTALTALTLTDASLAKTERSKDNGLLLMGLRWGIPLYCLQALPYGKAAAAGMWANLVLWAAFALALRQSFQPPMEKVRT